MSNQKIFKVIFRAYVETLTLALKFSCLTMVIWKRGQKSVEVKQRKQIVNGRATFNEILEINCNMTYDEQQKIFQEKKTKFTIVMYSDKGNKQAGEVHFNLADILNSKKKQLKYQKNLEKCPDKNAMLTFILVSEIKEQIIINHNHNHNQIENNNQIIVQNEIKPDFRKKKQNNQKQKNIIDNQNIIRPISIDKLSLIKIQQQNKELMQKIQEISQLEFENQELKRKYNQLDKKAVVYYKKKFDEMKKQYNQYKDKDDKMKDLKNRKNEIEKDICQVKEKMGRILNYALAKGYNQLAEQLYCNFKQ